MNIIQRKRRIAEAQARVAALRHNYSGTYAAAYRGTQISAQCLSLWHRGIAVPRDTSLLMLRDVSE